MHTTNDYDVIVQWAIDQLRVMIQSLPKAQQEESTEILSFLLTHGCYGYPVGQNKGDIEIGSRLNGTDIPRSQQTVITIIPCFSDDVQIGRQPCDDDDGCTAPGRYFWSDQIIALYNVNHWSPPELALTLFHEARHARHRTGPKLTDLQPLESDFQHETNTWITMLNLLVAWGGKAWQKSVQQEIDWLTAQDLRPATHNEILYAQSKQYWPELDRVFGTTAHAEVRYLREALVCINAHMQYWTKRNRSFTPEQICHSLISRFYIG